jgi:hypothetical protein
MQSKKESIFPFEKFADPELTSVLFLDLDEHTPGTKKIAVIATLDDAELLAFGLTVASEYPKNPRARIAILELAEALLISLAEANQPEIPRRVKVIQKQLDNLRAV